MAPARFTRLDRLLTVMDVAEQLTLVDLGYQNSHGLVEFLTADMEQLAGSIDVVELKVLGEVALGTLAPQHRYQLGTALGPALLHVLGHVLNGHAVMLTHAVFATAASLQMRTVFVTVGAHKVALLGFGLHLLIRPRVPAPYPEGLGAWISVVKLKDVRRVGNSAVMALTAEIGNKHLLDFASSSCDFVFTHLAPAEGIEPSYLKLTAWSLTIRAHWNEVKPSRGWVTLYTPGL